MIALHDRQDRVRLAEVVAALSLGVELGFGSMEHVLRQCLIALRIAERAGLGEYRLPSARGAIATIRLLGSGHPLIRRFRIVVEFAVGGHRDLDRMVEHHSTIACSRALVVRQPLSRTVRSVSALTATMLTL